MLKLQNNENEELKQRIQKLETAFAASASALAQSQSASTMAVTTVAENNKHFV
jgi:O-acetylhomoserine/O-acetylserine sulfhydrylase-like pyridoxal-dependent enzyme